MTPKERKQQADKERKTRNEAIYADSEAGMSKEELATEVWAESRSPMEDFERNGHTG